MSPSDRQPPTSILVSSGGIHGRLDLALLFDWTAGPRPVEVEVGFGKGRVLLATARTRPDRDHLGIEHARALVRKVQARAERAELPNVRLYHGNAKDVVMRLLPDASIERVRVDFPDPWPKRRHGKHRFFAGGMVEALARVLRPGGDLLLSTDHDAYHREALQRLGAHPGFVRTTTEEAFHDLPRGGFEAIFAAQDVPILRARWERVARPEERGGAAAP